MSPETSMSKPELGVEVDAPTATSYTANEILTAINLALKDRDMPAVVALVHRLALVDPDAAQAILDMVEVANRCR